MTTTPEPKSSHYGTPLSLPDPFTAGKALTPSCLPLQHVINGIQNAASGADRWQRSEDRPPFFTGTSEAGSTIVEYNNTTMSIEQLWAHVQQFSDLDGDVLLAVFAQLLTSPMENDRRGTWIYASNILEYRGLTPRMQADTPGGPKRRAGHRYEDLNDIARSIERISDLWVTIQQIIKEDAEPEQGKRRRRKPKKREYTQRSRVVNLESMWYQRELTDDINEPVLTKPIYQTPIGWYIRAGKWLEPFLENRQVAWICKQALEYDPHNEMWEKRLARYFFFHFRMNASAGSFHREIGKLLQALSLPIDKRFPERNTKQRFEKALNRLTKDRQIDGWEYTEEIDLQSRGWLPTWLQQKVRIYIAPYRSLKVVENQEKLS